MIRQIDSCSVCRIWAARGEPRRGRGRGRARVMLVMLALVATVLLPGAACGSAPETAGPRYGTAPPSGEARVYTLAVHPLYNPARLLGVYQPLVDYLNREIPTSRITLEASRDYTSFEEKYGARIPDLLLPNPWQTLQAIKVGYHVIAMAGEPEDFRGIFIVRKDGAVRQPADLKGKSVSYPAATALAACIMPQAFLHQNGLDVNRDIENRYVGSQESSIMSVHLGLTAAGATWPPPWRIFQRDHPREAGELMVAWETESLVNNSFMARDDVPAEMRTRIQTLLVGLYRTAEGRALLADMETARFSEANDQDYDVVRTFLSSFERDVRKVQS